MAVGVLGQECRAPRFSYCSKNSLTTPVTCLLHRHRSPEPSARSSARSTRGNKMAQASSVDSTIFCRSSHLNCSNITLVRRTFLHVSMDAIVCPSRSAVLTSPVPSLFPCPQIVPNSPPATKAQSKRKPNTTAGIAKAKLSKSRNGSHRHSDARLQPKSLC